MRSYGGTQPCRAAPACPHAPPSRRRAPWRKGRDLSLLLTLKKQQHRKSEVFPTPSQGLHFYDNTSQQLGSWTRKQESSLAGHIWLWP